MSLKILQNRFLKKKSCCFKKNAWVCFLLSGALWLSSCGFSPLYQKDKTKEENAVIAKTSLVRVEPIADRLGQKMRWDLQDFLNPNKSKEAPRYVLIVSLKRYLEREQGIRDDNIATRNTVAIVAKYQLKDIISQKVLISDSVTGRASYNILKQPYATYVTSQEADTDVVKVLAQDISLRIATFFKNEEKGLGPILSTAPSKKVGTESVENTGEEK